MSGESHVWMDADPTRTRLETNNATIVLLYNSLDSLCKADTLVLLITSNVSHLHTGGYGLLETSVIPTVQVFVQLCA